MFKKLEFHLGRPSIARSIVVIGAALLAGCQDSAPTAAVFQPTTTGAAQFVAVEDHDAAALAIDDAIDRIVPALSDAASAERLANALRVLQQALATGHAADGPALARVAQAELTPYARLHPEDAADVDAATLALAVVIAAKH